MGFLWLCILLSISSGDRVLFKAFGMLSAALKQTTCFQTCELGRMVRPRQQVRSRMAAHQLPWLKSQKDKVQQQHTSSRRDASGSSSTTTTSTTTTKYYIVDSSTNISCACYGGNPGGIKVRSQSFSRECRLPHVSWAVRQQKQLRG